jgi:restriction system protein
MAIPDYQTITLPLLVFASDSQEHTSREAAAFIANNLGLSEQEQTQLYPTGKKMVFLDRVEWAKTYLKQAGLLQSPRRTYFTITSLGLPTR